MKITMINSLAAVTVAAVAAPDSAAAAAVVELTIDCPLFLPKKTTRRIYR